MQEECHTSLREKKRLETTRNIEEAATRLVDEKGLSNVTVEEICGVVGISRRTFFNYFDSKDEAVFGTALVTPDPAIRERFLTEETDNLIKFALELIAEMHRKQGAGDDITARRKRLLQQPEAAAIAVSHHRTRVLSLIDTVEARLEAFPADRRRPDLPVRKEAFIIAAFVREAMWLHGLLGETHASAAQTLTDYAKGMKW